ncbi:hypothetical protein LY76DRAFT_342963 [Colletotrichum caudatum]|nr:hypothetical protein LY76DRAFT_342963 [Colletotrichum caudatum]
MNHGVCRTSTTAPGIPLLVWKRIPMPREGRALLVPSRQGDHCQPRERTSDTLGERLSLSKTPFVYRYCFRRNLQHPYRGALMATLATAPGNGGSVKRKRNYSNSLRPSPSQKPQTYEPARANQPKLPKLSKIPTYNVVVVVVIVNSPASASSIGDARNSLWDLNPKKYQVKTSHHGHLAMYTVISVIAQAVS